MMKIERGWEKDEGTEECMERRQKEEKCKKEGQKCEGEEKKKECNNNLE